MSNSPYHTHLWNVSSQRDLTSQLVLHGFKTRDRGQNNPLNWRRWRCGRFLATGQWTLCLLIVHPSLAAAVDLAVSLHAGAAGDRTPEDHRTTVNITIDPVSLSACAALPAAATFTFVRHHSEKAKTSSICGKDNRVEERHEKDVKKLRSSKDSLLCTVQKTL